MGFNSGLKVLNYFIYNSWLFPPKIVSPCYRLHICAFPRHPCLIHNSCYGKAETWCTLAAEGQENSAAVLQSRTQAAWHKNNAALQQASRRQFFLMWSPLWGRGTYDHILFQFYRCLQNCEKRLLTSSCPSVSPSAWNNSAATEENFVKFGIWALFRKSVEKIQLSLKSD
jgi:hypothetical protein